MANVKFKCFKNGKELGKNRTLAEMGKLCSKYMVWKLHTKGFCIEEISEIVGIPVKRVVKYIYETTE